MSAPPSPITRRRGGRRRLAMFGGPRCVEAYHWHGAVPVRPRPPLPDGRCGRLAVPARLSVDARGSGGRLAAQTGRVPLAVPATNRAPSGSAGRPGGAACATAPVARCRRAPAVWAALVVPTDKASEQGAAPPRDRRDQRKGSQGLSPRGPVCVRAGAGTRGPPVGSRGLWNEQPGGSSPGVGRSETLPPRATPRPPPRVSFFSFSYVLCRPPGHPCGRAGPQTAAGGRDRPRAAGAAPHVSGPCERARAPRGRSREMGGETAARDPALLAANGGREATPPTVTPAGPVRGFEGAAAAHTSACAAARPAAGQSVSSADPHRAATAGRGCPDSAPPAARVPVAGDA